MNLVQLFLAVVMFGSLFSVLTLSLNLQYARGGMINFGTVAYFAAGAYAYAIVHHIEVLNDISHLNGAVRYAPNTPPRYLL